MTHFCGLMDSQTDLNVITWKSGGKTAINGDGEEAQVTLIGRFFQ